MELPGRFQRPSGFSSREQISVVTRPPYGGGSRIDTKMPRFRKIRRWGA